MSSIPETTCIAPAEISSFMSGHIVDEQRFREIETHLSNCETCQQFASDTGADEFERIIADNYASQASTSRRLAEGYELIEELGRGGSGVVYRAKQPNLEREVAVKMLLSGVHSTRQEMARFKREAASLAQLDHPNIVRIIDSGEQDGVPFLAMELIEGETLADVVNRKPMHPRDAAQLILTVAEAVQAAHEHQIIHRDLKPQNVVLCRRNKTIDPPDDSDSEKPHANINESVTITPKILDFGLSQLADDDCVLTKTGQPLGTPVYMAPEMAKGDKSLAGPATDIYGLGATLYHCLAGRPPVIGSNSAEVLREVRQNNIVPLQVIRHGIPVDLRTICEKCLRLNPRDRFVSARELRNDLSRFLNREPIKSRPVPRFEIALRWCQRNPWPTVAIAMTGMAILVSIAAMLFHQNRLSEERDLARTNYEQTRKTLWQILDVTADQSSFDTPGVSAIASEQLTHGLALFEQLAAVEESEQAMRDLAKIRVRAGTVLLANGENDAGIKLLNLAQETWQNLAIANAADSETLGYLIEAKVKHAIALAGNGEIDEAIELLGSTLVVAKYLYEESPEDVDRGDNLAWVHHTLGTVQHKNQNYLDAKTNFSEAVRLRSLASQKDQDNLKLQRRISESQSSLGTCHMALHELVEAEQCFTAAVESLNALLEKDNHDSMAMIAIAIAELNRCNILAGRSDIPGAVKSCTNGIEILQKLLDVEPTLWNAKHNISMLYGNRALFKMNDDRFDDSVDDWNNSIQFAVEDHVLRFSQLNLIWDLTRQSRFLEGLKEIEEIAADEQIDEAHRFELCVKTAELMDAFDPESENWISAQKQIAHLISELTEKEYFKRVPDSAEKVQSSAVFASFREHHNESSLGSLLGLD